LSARLRSSSSSSRRIGQFVRRQRPRGPRLKSQSCTTERPIFQRSKNHKNMTVVMPDWLVSSTGKHRPVLLCVIHASAGVMGRPTRNRCKGMSRTPRADEQQKSLQSDHGTVTKGIASPNVCTAEPRHSYGLRLPHTGTPSCFNCMSRASRCRLIAAR